MPPTLERWKHKMLLAGKYLNVIRECGIEIGKDGAIAEEELSIEDDRCALVRFKVPQLYD